MIDIQWSDADKELFNSCFIGGKWDDESGHLRYIFKNGQSWQIVKTPKATIQDIEIYIENMYLGAELIGYKGRPSETAKAISAGSPSLIEFVPTIKPEGISRRDYFAAMAMQGLISGTIGVESLAAIHPASHASMAVICADALLYELDKKENESGN